ncbi:OmpA family protein [Segetibacter aerophilus]|uniref:OmpA-like domain-containing protein n=1 Tax=Segetibacter aerophilus TaxID=670293 RepID=A0A512BGS0_9BACT|nr:OmpA family protein [Segetibacter aerophilus]GEO11162.1 hypothetical protein SAE01_36580 [Segetibacter aerophilus]
MVVNLKYFQYNLTSITLGMLFSVMAFSVSGQSGRSNCKLGPLPSVQFASGSSKLLNSSIALLSAAAQNIKENPGCKVKIVGFGTYDKRTQQLSWDHVNAVIRYFVEKQGIAEDRFIFIYGEDGPATSVDILATTEDGPETVPAPHPTYSSSGPKRRN